MVNKMKSAIVGTKRSPTKLKVGYTTKTSKLAEQEAPPRRSSIKERQENTYTFHPDDLESIFKQTMESQDIILPESKRQAKADKVNNLKYYKYHRYKIALCSKTSYKN